MRIAIVLSIFHDTRLAALVATYPGLQFLYDRYHPLHVALMAGYNTKGSASAAKEGDKITVSQFFVSAKAQLVEEWLPAILLLHPVKSSRYKSLFPDNLKPFNSGSIDNRIAAYNMLATNIGSEAALATLKAAILTTYNQLLLARSVQLAAKANSANNSNALNLLRIAAMDMQYRNVGYIIDKFFD